MKSIFKRFINWVKLRIYEILYVLLLMVLSSYIVVNWEKCITMKFFEQFDGNNILFLIWIVLFILPFYDVEAKGWKFRRKGIEDTRKQFENAENTFRQNQINNFRDDIQTQNSDEIDGGWQSMINYQSKQIVIDALIKVINAAPGLYSKRNYLYNQTYQNGDISMQEFNTWVDYANQILDISYNHIGYNAILTTKIAIGQLSSQHGASFIQRVDQIKRELLNLAQLILQYQ